MTHPVIAALAKDDVAGRRAACAAAPEDPSAVLLIDALVDALGDPDVGVVRAAVAALERIGRDHDVLIALSPALRSEDPHQRLEAAWTWARVDPPPVKLLPAVVSTLEHLAGDARWRAARLLVEMGRLHGEVAPVVMNLAGEAYPARVRRIALTALREMAPGSDETIAAHLEASRSDDAGLCRLGLTGLAGMKPATPAMWKRFVEVLREHEDPACRRIAASAAAALGDPPAEVRAAVAHCAEADDDRGAREAAARALGQLDASA